MNIDFYLDQGQLKYEKLPTMHLDTDLIISVHVRNNEDNSIHILIYPTQDIPGDWTGHVLDADLVTQGQSPGEALDMAIDAYTLIPDHCRDRPAPRECYAEHEMFRSK